MKNNNAMQALSYGLFVLCAHKDGRDNGCVINTVIQATTSPNRVLFTVNKSSHTCSMLNQGSKFTLSVLSQGAGLALFERFGFRSGKDTDKFSDFAGAVRADNGVMRLTQGINAWLAGSVVSTQDLGTHVLFLADVDDGDVVAPEAAATYAFYHAHIKPQPAAAAPAPSGGKKRWVCKVCGYVYEGAELPADFICPLCKHPASDFEPMG